LEKSDFSNRAQDTQEIRFFWKNRISQTVPKIPKKSDFFGKIGFLKPCPSCPTNPIFWKNRICFEMEWSGNFRFRVLVQESINSRTTNKSEFLEKPVLLAQSIRLVPKSVVLMGGMKIYALLH
jgi:hypothetical protein